jgi:hypothetical protein
MNPKLHQFFSLRYELITGLFLPKQKLDLLFLQKLNLRHDLRSDKKKDPVHKNKQKISIEFISQWISVSEKTQSNNFVIEIINQNAEY